MFHTIGMIEHKIRHVMPCMKIVDGYQLTSFFPDRLLVSGPEMITIQHHDLFTVQVFAEAQGIVRIISCYGKMDHRFGDLVDHFEDFIAGLLYCKNNVEVLPDHIGQREAADNMSHPDGCASVCTYDHLFFHVVPCSGTSF